jgi:hypothetical protein
VATTQTETNNTEPAAVTANRPTINEMLGEAPPTTDERVIATYRGILEASAHAAADAVAELVLQHLEQRGRGE